MKYSYFIIIVYIWFVLTTVATGQSATANASVHASIIQPINLVRVRNMDFGRVSPGTTPGTVVLAPTESGTRTISGGVSLPSGSSTVNSAKFIINGMEGYTFTIILPSAAITLSDGTHFMFVDNFTSTPSGSGTLNSGAQTICVGATLNVNANQEAGNYVSTEDFEVTVAYN